MSDPVNVPKAKELLGTQLSRRNMLRAMGIGGAALASGPLLAACGSDSGTAAASSSSTAAAGSSGNMTAAQTSAASSTAGASISGGKGFDWMQAKGKTIRMLRTPHPVCLGVRQCRPVQGLHRQDRHQHRLRRHPRR